MAPSLLEPSFIFVFTSFFFVRLADGLDVVRLGRFLGVVSRREIRVWADGQIGGEGRGGEEKEEGGKCCDAAEGALFCYDTYL